MWWFSPDVGTSATTTFGVTGRPTSTTSAGAADSSGTGGFSQSDKIALGCGIGVGVPATLAAIAGLWLNRSRRRSSHATPPPYHYGPSY